MKKTIQIFFSIIILITCKGKDKKFINNDKSSVNVVQGNYKTKDTNVTDCYTYLTELIRSSNFPFANWNVPKNQVNIIIDEETETFVRAKLVMETHGTGTIGWVEFYYNTGKLLNTSADLEHPQQLSYDKKWRNKLDSCKSKKRTLQKN